MPIPTRTLSQRQARQSIIPTPRTTTNNNTSSIPKHAAGGEKGSRPNSSAANNNNASSERPLSRSGIPQLAQRDCTVTTTTTTTQKKSLLPQRSLQSGSGDGSGPVAKPPASLIPGSRSGEVDKRTTPGTATTSQNPPRDVVPAVQGHLETTNVEVVESRDTPPQSQETKYSPTVANTPSAATPAPPSPHKKSQQQPPPPSSSSTLKPAALKKNDMPPPPRPNRSASLRQPVAASPIATSSSAGMRTHIRHRSQIIPPSTTTPLKKQQGDAGYGGSSVVSGHRAKPSFSTFQQQFSPRKPAIPSSSGPKTATTPTPASTPAATATGPDASSASSSLISSSWPEIASLQTELLQLSLLHSSSLDKDMAWKVAAEKQLRTKYDAVAGTYRDVLKKEKEYQRWINARALDKWMQYSHSSESSSQGRGRGRNGGASCLPFAEQVQIFSRILQDVSDLTESGVQGGGGGRYTLVLGAFEAWLQHAQQVQRHREHLQRLNTTTDADHLSAAAAVELSPTFIESLDQVWKDELGSLLSKMELCARQLQGLDVLCICEEHKGDATQTLPLGESSLVRIATGLSETLDMMIEEIHVMREIEREIVRGEREWARRLTERVVAGRRSAPAVCRDSRESEMAMSLRGLWRDTSLT